VLGASGYGGSLESTVLDGLLAIGADVRGADVLLKPNLVEFDPTTAINTEPRLIAATVLAFRRLGAASVRVAEGPGHRRDVQDVVTRSGLADALTGVEAPFVDLNAAAIRNVSLRSSYTELRAAVAADSRPRRRRRRLDAQDEDAPLGGRHVVAQEPVRHPAGLRVRVAEEHPALGSDRAVDPRHRGLGATCLRDHRRDRRYGG
jgi:hypothetical protein